MIDLDEARIKHMRKVMIWYKEQLKRDEPWRMAWNKNDALVVAYKLTRENLADLLKLLGSDLSPDARLHRARATTRSTSSEWVTTWSSTSNRGYSRLECPR